MADEIDRAQARDEYFRELALSGHRRSPGSVHESPLNCVDCETEIPEARRLAVPGCLRCISCQSLHENWRPC